MTCMGGFQGVVEVVVGEVMGVDEVAVGEVEVTDLVATVLVVAIGEVVIVSVMTVLPIGEVVIVSVTTALLTEEVTGLVTGGMIALVIVEDELLAVTDLVTEEAIDSLEELVAVQLGAQMIGVLVEHQAVAAAVGMMTCLTVSWSRDQVAQTGDIYF